MSQLWGSVGSDRLPYLVLAALVLLLALWWIRRVIAPIGPVVQAFVAMVGVVAAIGMALVLIVAGAFAGG